jgi:AcrR family transcriptional regulator
MAKQQFASIIKEKDLSAYPPRQRILAAALKLFVEQGYFNTKVPDLSKESQCSVGSIYHSFKNKEEVAKALYDEGISSFRQALYEAIEDADDTQRVVTVLIKSFLEFSEVNYQISKYIWLCRHNEFMSGLIRHPTMVGFDMLGRKLTRVIKKGIRNGEIRPMKANVLWSVLFGIPLGYVRDWFDGFNPDSPRQVADEIAAACWRALQTEKSTKTISN